MEACQQPSSRSLIGLALPPAPPPPMAASTSLCPHAPPPTRSRHDSQGGSAPWWKTWMKKYVILCLICGGLSVLLGIIFIGIYFTLRSYTSSLQFFETVPTYVPAVVLIVTGLIVMCFAKRRNRYAYLIKVAGVCCLICALLCVVITVTTTVVHMNRLQTLHECVYTPKVKICTCVSAMADLSSLDGAHHFVFNNTPNCEVVHGSLYACLRALFGLSVIGILVCIFSSMLVYQLLTHERKKMYWEQLELRRRFLHRRNHHHHHHHAFCNCYEDMYPWQLWEMLDYRFLNSQPLTPSPLLDEGSPPPAASTSNNLGYGGGVHQPSGWNWLPWPWHAAPVHHRPSRRARNEDHHRGGFISRLIARDRWGSEELASSSVPSPQESPTTMHPDSPGGLFPWRSEFLHVFRHNLRSDSGSLLPPPPPPRFGVRSRASGGMHHSRPGGHRRTRSNDGVFHHLQMNPAARFPHGFPHAPDGSAALVPYQFAGYADIPHYLWGPPPPYSQPPSMENIACFENQQSMGNDAQENQRNNVNRERSGIRGTSAERCHDPLVITASPMIGGGGSDLASSSHSSKMSTPLAERRLVCSNFSTDGITLTIGSGNYSDVCSQNDSSIGNDEFKQRGGEDDDDACIVEVHVPFIGIKKQEIVFNTLPTRSSKKRDSNPFTSLSNIPLCLSRKLNGMKNCNESLSVIETVCETKSSPYCSLEELSRLNDVKNILCDALSKSRPAKAVLYKSSGSGCSTPRTDSGSQLSSPTFHPTIVELPSDFKSSIVIATSPSTPVTENSTVTEMVYAHSMPNLSLSSSPTLLCRVHRAPSSGNTSTSQDFADFELEEDSLPVDVGGASSDILHASPLPHDDEQYAERSDSSSLQNSRPHKCYGRCHSSDTSSGSPAYYCPYKRVATVAAAVSSPLGSDPLGNRYCRNARILLSSSLSPCSGSTSTGDDDDTPPSISSSLGPDVTHEPPSAFRNAPPPPCDAKDEGTLMGVPPTRFLAERCNGTCLLPRQPVSRNRSDSIVVTITSINV